MAYYFTRLDDARSISAAGSGRFGTLAAGDVSVRSDAPVDGFDVFLLAGDDNMLGVGGPVTDPATADALDPRTLGVQQWGANAGTVTAAVGAADPLQHAVRDAAQQGASIGLTFGRLHHAATRRNVLLVPAAAPGATLGPPTSSDAATLADGTRGFANWAVPADDVEAGAGFGWLTSSLTGLAVRRANEAMAYHPVRNPYPGAAGASSAPDPANRFRGILWHHGVADAGVAAGPYRARLAALVGYLRDGIRGASAATPFLAGMPTQQATNAFHDRGPANVVPLVGDAAYFGHGACLPVSAANLANVSEFRAFTNDAVRELGRRYHAAFNGAAAALPGGGVTARPLDTNLVLRAEFDGQTRQELAFDAQLGVALAAGGPAYANLTFVSATSTWGNVRLVADAARGFVMQPDAAHLLHAASITQTYTKAAWVHPTYVLAGAGDIAHILSCDSQSRTRVVNGTSFRRAGLALRQNNRLVVEQYSSGSGLPEVLMPVTVTLPARAWTHVAVTCSLFADALAAQRSNVSVYVNGAYVTSNVATGPVGVGTPLPPHGIGGVNGGSRFHGYLDDVRLYSRALTAQEIAQLALFR